jgi:hypothetical protein
MGFHPRQCPFSGSLAAAFVIQAAIVVASATRHGETRTEGERVAVDAPYHGHGNTTTGDVNPVVPTRAHVVVVARAVRGGARAAQLEARKIIATRPMEDVHVVMEPGVHVSDVCVCVCVCVCV